MAKSLQEQAEEYRALLRLAVSSHPGPLPPRLANWWVNESAEMSREANEKATRIAARRDSLLAKIAELQAEVDAL